MIGLTYVREKLKLTMEEVGEKIRVSKQTISLWENGKSNIPEKRLKELSGIFGVREHFISCEVDDLVKLEIEYALLENEYKKFEEAKDYESIEKIDKQRSDFYLVLEAKRMLKESEKLLKNPNNIEIFKMVNIFLRHDNKINRKLVHDTLFAMQKIFLIGMEDDDFSRALAKVLKRYDLYLKEINAVMKERFKGKDPFEDDCQYPGINHVEINFD